MQKATTVYVVAFVNRQLLVLIGGAARRMMRRAVSLVGKIRVVEQLLTLAKVVFYLHITGPAASKSV